MTMFKILTSNGVADAGQEQILLDIAARLAQPGAKLLLHLHGGLVDEVAGSAAADRLGGQTDKSWKLDDKWTQVYVVWRTGAFETIRINWTELLQNDRLYQTIVRKLIGFVARRLGLPALPGAPARGPGTFQISDADIQKRLSGKAGPRPFDELDAKLAPTNEPGVRAALPEERSDGQLALDFRNELAKDTQFQKAATDIDEAVNVHSGARAPSLGADLTGGEKSLRLLSKSVRLKMEPPPAAAGEARGVVSVTTFLLSHAVQIALRCIKRFRNGRDHGLHATVVEEVCRELYGDLVGATVWGMMVRDAGDHFGSGKLGSSLIDIVKAAPPETFVITAHSAGSIWASQFLRAAKAAGVTKPVELFLLAPAVREDLFDKMLTEAGDLIGRCRMITMTDEAERRDAVLGHDKGYIYPSSLLYLVSGMFEEQSAKAYPDAPILGMQRFAGLTDLSAPESDAAKRIAAFFQAGDHAILSAPAAGISKAESHGDFDNEPLTLQTARALF